MERIFDRNNYSQKTIETYEVLSAYFVDIFYNHLYAEAKKLKISGSASSITEGYKHTLNAFLNGLKTPKIYKKSLIGIHNYYDTIGLTIISFAKCVDSIAKEFIPSDYFNSISSTQKMGVLRMVLNQAIKNFIKKIVDSYMTHIIDNHMEKDNVRLLQDDLIDFFILERESMYQRFISDQTVTNKDETVNRVLAERMQSEIKKLVKEKYEFKQQIVILKKAYIMKKQSENKLNEIISELRGTITELENKNQPKTNYSGGNTRSSFMIQSDNANNNQDSNSDSSSTSLSILQNKNTKQNIRAQITNTPTSNPNTPSQQYIQQTNQQPTMSKQPIQQPLQQAKQPSTLSGQNIYQSTSSQQHMQMKPAPSFFNSSNQPSSNHSSTQPPLNNSKYSDISKYKIEIEESNKNISKDESDSSNEDDEDASENFIEVTDSNMSNVINKDSDYLQNLHDSNLFNTKMDSGTMLDDF